MDKKDEINFRLEDFTDVLGNEAAVVKSCPVSKASRGVITMAPSLIAMVAGAAEHDIEWIVLLNGTRSTDGFEVVVDKITVPQQERGGAHADILETEIASDVVGVMHLHPWKTQARFSGIDDSTLNPRFPCSVVVSPARNNLGFSYEACGKVILPCGSVGEEVVFELAVAGVDRFAQEVVRAQHTGEVTDLGDCAQWSAVSSTEYTRIEHAVCGLTTRETDTPVVFGTEGGDQLLKVIGEQTKETPKPAYGGYQGSYSGLFSDNNGGYRQNLIGDSKPTGTSYWDKFKPRKGKKRGKGQFSARRNGLVKLERPEADDRNGFGTSGRSGAYMMRMCDSCRTSDMTKLNEPFDQWLCGPCWEEAEEILADALKDDAVQEFEVVMD